MISLRALLDWVVFKFNNNVLNNKNTLGLEPEALESQSDFNNNTLRLERFWLEPQSHLNGFE